MNVRARAEHYCIFSISVRFMIWINQTMGRLITETQGPCYILLGEANGISESFCDINTAFLDIISQFSTLVRTAVTVAGNWC